MKGSLIFLAVNELSPEKVLQLPSADPGNVIGSTQLNELGTRPAVGSPDCEKDHSNLTRSPTPPEMPRLRSIFDSALCAQSVCFSAPRQSTESWCHDSLSLDSTVSWARTWPVVPCEWIVTAPLPSRSSAVSDALVVSTCPLKTASTPALHSSTEGEIRPDMSAFAL